MILACFVFLSMLPKQGSAATVDSIIATAKQYIGVRYVFGGSTPSGFDCSGYLKYVFNQFGITLPRTASEQYQVGEPVARENLQKGDLVFFETYKKGPSHSGMYLGDGTFISATSSSGVAIVSMNNSYWAARYIGAKRVLKEELPILPAGSYYDVPETYWAYNEIKELGMQKIVGGYEYSFFQPENTITRAEAAAILVRANALTTTNLPSPFYDVPADHWAASVIATAVQAGYFVGFEDGSFRPNDPLTREQTAALLSRIFSFKESGESKLFADINEQDWSYPAIQILSANNVTVGFEDNTFRPKDGVSRAQFVVFLYRAMF